MSTDTTRNARPAADIATAPRPAAPGSDADFEAIESFLRDEMQGGGDASKFSDPLMAELARIVGQQGAAQAAPRPEMPPAHDPFAVDSLPPVTRPGLDDPHTDPLRAFEEELRRFDAQNRVAPSVQEPVVTAAPAIEVAPPVQAGPYAYQPVEPQYQPVLVPAGTAYPGEAQPQPYPAPDDLSGVVAPDLAAEDTPRPRNKKVMMMLGGAAAMAVIGVVGAVGFRPKAPPPGTAPVIAAKTSPVKEKPADPGGVEISGQDRQVLAKKQDEPKGPATVVSKEEQPVDLNQTPKREVSRVILPATGGAAAPGAAPAAPASPPGPILMPQGAQQPAAAPVQPPSAGGFEAKRVKSVKISGEGDVVPATSPPPPSRPATPSLASAPPPSAAPAAPARTSEAAPKSDARPTTAARPAQATTTPQRTAARPVSPAAEPQGGDAPLSLRPPSGGDSTANVRRNTPAQASGSGGGYAVQFAASPNQAEAQATANRIKQRHSSALGGYAPGVRQGQSGDKTVYRVRVSGLSRDKASELCSSIKSEGGTCYVAGN